MTVIDEDALYASVDLIGRTGAGGLEFGHLDDTDDVRTARWWATATFQGAKLMEEEHQGPVEALEALARRLLDGGLCAWCGARVTLAGDGLDPDTCRWRRTGARWDRGCIDTHTERTLARDGQPIMRSTSSPGAASHDWAANRPPNRAQRRRDARAARSLGKKRNNRGR